MDKKYILVILCLGLLFSASSASAIFPTYNYDPINKTAIVRDNFGFTDIATIQLISNTDQCLFTCEAVLKITPAKDLTASKSSDYNFKVIDALGRDALSSLKSFDTYQQVIEDYTTDVNDWGTCIGTQIDNKTSKEAPYNYSCVTGTHKELKQRQAWKPVDFSTLAFRNAEPVYIKIVGQKTSLANVDWQPTFYGQQIKEMQWWNSSWAKKQAINISTISGSVASGFVYDFNVTYDADMQANFGDLRFVNGSENAKLPYFIGMNSSSSWAYVYILLDSPITTTNQTIYMYFGNAGASTTSNGSTVFTTFFDHFNNGSTLDTTKWTKINVDGVLIGSSIMNLSQTGTYGSALASNSNWTAPNTLTIYSRFDSAGPFQGWYTGQGSGESIIITKPNAIGENGNVDYFVGNASGYNYAYSNATILGAWHRHDIMRNTTDTFFVQDNVSQWQIYRDIATVRNIRFWTTANRLLQVDWVGIRPYDASWQNIASYFGAEQTSGSLTISPNAPTNNTVINNTQTALFNFTADSSTNTTFNCSFVFDGTLNITNTVSNNTLTNFNKTEMTYGLHNWSVNCTDSAASNTTGTLALTVNDTISPAWSNNITSIPSNYSTTNQSQFNITWSDNGGIGVNTTLIEGNWSGSSLNYTMTNNSGVYSYNGTLPAGNYYWKSYANDTYSNWNTSDTWYFTIGQANNNVFVYINSTENSNVTMTYGDQANLTVSSPIGNLTMYVNGTNTTYTDYTTYGAGMYNITAYTTGNANYTSNSTTFWLTVNQAVPTMSVYLNGTHGNKTYALNTIGNWTGALTVAKIIQLNSSYPGFANLSGATPQGNDSVSLGTSGIYAVIGYFAGDTNYTSANEIFYANVTYPPVITINSPLNISYGTNDTWNNITTDIPSGWCGFSYNGGSNVTLSNSSQTFWYNQTTNQTLGSHNVKFYCNDTIGSMGNSSMVYYTISPNTVALNAPADAIVFNDTQNITFNFTITSPIDLTLNCSIYLDSGLNQSNNTVGNNTLTNFNINGINYGNHSWFVGCSDSAVTVNSSARTFTIADTIAPSVVLGPPANNTLTSATTVNFTCNSTDDIALKNVTLISGTGCYQETANTSTACGGLGNGTYGVNTGGFTNTSALIDGDWNTFGTGTGADNRLQIDYYVPSGVSNATWLYKYTNNGTITTTQTAIPSACWNGADVKLLVQSLNGGSNELGFYCYNWTAAGWLYGGLTQYTSQNETSKIYEEAITWGGLSNATSQNISGTSNSTIFPVTATVNTNYSWYCQVCDNFSNCAYSASNYTLFIAPIINSETTGQVSILEGEVDYFDLNISYPNTEIGNIRTYLVYNGTSYNGSASTSGNTTLFYKSLTIPSLSNSTAQTISYYWEIRYLNGTSIFNQASHNQQINPYGIIISSTACAGGLVSSQNYTFADENDLFSLDNINVAINFQFGSATNLSLKTISQSLTNIYSFVVCLNASLAPYYVGYGEIQYTKSGYIDRRYYLWINSTLTSTTEYKTLYLLEINPNPVTSISNSTTIGNATNSATNTSTYQTTSAGKYATSFYFVFTDMTLKKYVGYYGILLRWYPGINSYNTVEMTKTDSNGQGLMRLVTENVDYKIGLYYPNGTLVKLSEPTRLACSAYPCTYTMRIDQQDTSYLDKWNIQFTPLNWNNATKTYSFTYSDASARTHSMTMLVYKDMGNNSITVCNTTINGAIGSLNCNASIYADSGILRAEIWHSASDPTPFDSRTDDMTSSLFTGSLGLLIALFIFMCLALIGIFAPEATIILGIVGLIPAVAFHIFSMAIMFLFAVMGGIAIHLIKRVS